ncbi:hypothetical protein [Legionella hackeliae]|uniref:Outer membrane protein beta-barrel domain-containing protein n=1 Tax=Legionella hackeliae TaxID=449 RepID=A0A0A8UX06_LEGHA|nr:hypothetical protein [Legionella hackeliae]KTD06592.1 hypothetical protein Lhac_3198 [Legionella hackeliae]CEK11607.1 conserved protein of unknown function [Legionella hackeliae]CEK11610.1 conserved protein of unknown function [Legionella hackeliae]STX48378.1 Uncharacterised protein [Legionella hackeliae]STX48380.1 Uncharacterised protein [Legionella hackeliae]
MQKKENDFGLYPCNQFIKAVLIASCFLSHQSIASTMGPTLEISHPWSVTGSIGYTVYEDMFRADGETALGRFAIGRDVYTGNSLTWGLELGVQSGNTMRYFPSPAAIDGLGGLPIQTTVKPMLDALVTIKTASFDTIPIFFSLKGGIAYRRWQFNDRDSINDKSQIAGEVQAGVGGFISERVNLSLSYQGIFGSNPDFRFNADSATGRVSNIPVQNGVLLGLTVTV